MFVIRTFYSVDKILSCYHSNETSLARLLHRTIYFLEFYETKFGIFGEFFALATLGVKGLKVHCIPSLYPRMPTSHGTGGYNKSNIPKEKETQ